MCFITESRRRTRIQTSCQLKFTGDWAATQIKNILYKEKLNSRPLPLNATDEIFFSVFRWKSNLAFVKNKEIFLNCCIEKHENIGGLTFSDRKIKPLISCFWTPTINSYNLIYLKILLTRQSKKLIKSCNKSDKKTFFRLKARK